MEIFTHDDLKALVKNGGGHCVSIYMPTEQTRPEYLQNAIRFKNHIREAEDQLVANGMESAEARMFLNPASDLLEDTPFWWHQKNGFAMFLRTGFFRYYRLPCRFDDIVTVGSRFHVAPLLRFLNEDTPFYLLALSQNEVRVFRCTRQTYQELQPQDIPASLAEAMRYDDPERQLQFHTGATPRKGQRAAMFFGHGAGTDDAVHKEDLHNFMLQIDRGLHDFLSAGSYGKQARAPLVLAGVEFLQSIYRQVNTCPNLLAEGIQGNPQDFTPQELHLKAWGILEPHFHETVQHAVDRFRQVAGIGTQPVSRDLESIVSAACHGRVEWLFMSEGARKFGTFDAHTFQARADGNGHRGKEDLFNLAATETLSHGGSVFVIEPESAPDVAPISALFRY